MIIIMILLLLLLLLLLSLILLVITNDVLSMQCRIGMRGMYIGNCGSISIMEAS